MNLFDIKNLIVLITGSTQGIGFGLARGFAQAGAKVYLNGRNQEKIEKSIQQLDSEGLVAHAACFDVNQTDQIQQGIERIISHSGTLDVLINNAGIIIRERLANLAQEDFEKVLRTDLIAPFVISKIAVQNMIKNQKGKIINICSLMSEIARETVGAYTAAKGGLKMLTKNMAVEWAPHNIQVNGIGPGFIATPINAAYREPGEPLNDYIISRTPAGRWGKPEDLVGAALFLASPASDFVNGQILYVDGGVTAAF